MEEPKTVTAPMMRTRHPALKNSTGLPPAQTHGTVGRDYEYKRLGHFPTLQNGPAYGEIIPLK